MDLQILKSLIYLDSLKTFQNLLPSDYICSKHLALIAMQKYIKIIGRFFFVSTYDEFNRGS